MQPPLTTPSPGHELCYECEGKRTCWSCFGKGRRANGAPCGECGGSGRCSVCQGDGELPIGAGAAADAAPTRNAIPIGWFRELGYETAFSLEQARGRDPAHTADVARYLRGGKILVASPGLARDIYDRGVVAGTHSLRTDGDFVWPDVLAHYVEKYGVALPPVFEARMEAAGWNPPTEIDVKRLGIKRSG